MTRFVFHGVDRADAGGLRADTRDAHAAYHRDRGNPVGGPLLDEDGSPCGTLVVFDATDLDEARTIVSADPYVRAGLFATVHLHAFHPVDWPT